MSQGKDEEGTGGVRRRPVLLCILDGFGWREERADNAVAQAQKPAFDRIWAAGPRCFLRTDGGHVGLPDGQFGNSEVGHMNLGAGRIVEQEQVRIARAFTGGEVARRPGVQALRERLSDGGGRCHLMGLVSPGGVHARQEHVAALARILAEAGVDVLIHAWLDGRDTPPRSAEAYLARLGEDVAGLDRVRVATVCGRYFAMDRDRRWERTARAYDAMVHGAGAAAADPLAAVRDAYADGQDDEFVEPRVIAGYDGMRAGDAVLCANFRADRVRQILSALVEPEFDGFDRGAAPQPTLAVGMVSYSDALDERLQTLFPPTTLDDTLGEVLAAAGRTQLRLAETEKYPHVTFFFDGGVEREKPGEARVLVPSPKVATYDLQPEMSAPEVADRLAEAIAGGKYDFILVNFANPDMVGHTGSLAAATKAVEAVDAGLGRALDALSAVGGSALVTADHGNCELMRDPQTGGPHTAHTTNPVPCVLVGGPPEAVLHDGVLADVAPTVLALLGLPQPEAMTGHSLMTRGNGSAGA